jgi:uncharacterized phiE125 gp8 family phage protein
VRYVLYTAATTAPITLAELRLAAKVDAHDDDEFLLRLISMATDAVQQQTGRQLITATWKLYLDEFPSIIEIGKLPVASVTSITYVDLAGTTQTLSASNYQTSILSPNTPARIMPAYGLTWPTVRGDTLDAICVTFTAGYGAASAVPDRMKHAVQLLCLHWYENREVVKTGTIVTTIQYGMDWLLSLSQTGQYA